MVSGLAEADVGAIARLKAARRRSGGRAVMADYPVNFSAPEVIALLSGGMTQTRRLATTVFARCRPGDRLWVRESFAPFAATPPAGRGAGRSRGPVLRSMSCCATAHGSIGTSAHNCRNALLNGAVGRRWRAPAAMPRWASRLTLTIETCRIERVQEIAPVAACAEGWQAQPTGLPSGAFRAALDPAPALARRCLARHVGSPARNAGRALGRRPGGDRVHFPRRKREHRQGRGVGAGLAGDYRPDNHGKSGGYHELPSFKPLKFQQWLVLLRSAKAM